MMILLYIFTVSLSFMGILIIGEYFANKFPNTRYSECWRKYVIGIED